MEVESLHTTQTRSDNAAAAANFIANEISTSIHHNHLLNILPSEVGLGEPTSLTAKNGQVQTHSLLTDPQPQPNLGRLNRNFTIATYNTRSLKSSTKENELINTMLQLKIDLIAIQEHKRTIDTDISIGLKENNLCYIYAGSHRGPDNGVIGGLGFLIAPHCTQAYIDCKVITDRILHARFRSSPLPSAPYLHIINVYAYTATDNYKEQTPLFYERLSALVNDIPSRDMLIIVGDFNATIDKETSGVLHSPQFNAPNLNTPHLSAFINNNDLIPINCRFRKSSKHHYTYQAPNQQESRRDYIITRGKWKSAFSNYTTKKVYTAYSDHKLIIASGKFKIKVRPPHPASTPRPQLQLLKENNYKDQFIATIVQQYTANLPGAPSLDDNNLALVNAISAGLAHVKIRRQTRRKCPWESPELIPLRNRVRAARKYYEENKTRENYELLKTENNNICEQYNKQYKQYLDEILESINQGSASEAWKSIKILAGEQDRKTSTKIADSAEESLKQWKEYFEKMKLPAQAQQTEFRARDLPGKAASLNALHYNTEPFNETELKSVIAQLRPNKAPGSDNIPAEVLQYTNLHGVILTIMNLAFSTQTVPKLWLQHILIPVPKKGDLSKCDNYRGIALMSVLAKVYDKLLLHRIQPNIETLLRNSQNGFRPQRSTTQHILAMRLLINQCETHHDLAAFITFIDFSKAFDCIRWDALTQILYKYGIPEKLVSAILSLYIGSSASVRTSDGCTDSFELKTGVLQGDTLAPYLFIIALDYILQTALTDPNIGICIKERKSSRSPARYLIDLTYADDIGLCSKSLAEAQSSLDKLAKIAAEIGLYINRKKTLCLYIHNNDLPPSETPHLTVGPDQGPIAYTNDFKYLGSYIRSSLTDFKHRKALAWLAIKKLKHIWESPRLSSEIKTNLFRQLIVPILFYAGETWIQTKQLQTAINGTYGALLRYARNIKWPTIVSNEVLYSTTARPLQILSKRILTIMRKAYHGPEQPLRYILAWRPKNKQRRGKTINPIQKIAAQITIGTNENIADDEERQSMAMEVYNSPSGKSYRQRIKHIDSHNVINFDDINLASPLRLTPRLSDQDSLSISPEITSTPPEQYTDLDSRPVTPPPSYRLPCISTPPILNRPSTSITLSPPSSPPIPTSFSQHLTDLALELCSDEDLTQFAPLSHCPSPTAVSVVTQLTLSQAYTRPRQVAPTLSPNVKQLVFQVRPLSPPPPPLYIPPEPPPPSSYSPSILSPIPALLPEISVSHSDPTSENDLLGSFAPPLCSIS